MRLQITNPNALEPHTEADDLAWLRVEVIEDDVVEAPVQVRDEHAHGYQGLLVVLHLVGGGKLRGRFEGSPEQPRDMPLSMRPDGWWTLTTDEHRSNWIDVNPAHVAAVEWVEEFAS